MELRQVKQIFCEQGEVRRILSGDVVLWEKTGTSGVGESGAIDDETPVSTLIPFSDDISGPLTDFIYYKYGKMTFTAPQASEWTISDIPAGLTSEVTDEGLVVSGYAEEICSKEVTVSAKVGETTRSKTYTLNVISDGYLLFIASTDLGYWRNGAAGVQSGTKEVSAAMQTPSGNSLGSFVGIAETSYVASGNPSWMNIDSRTGKLSGTPNSGYEAQSGNVEIYAINPTRKSPTKSLRWTTGNIVPRFRYSSIYLDITGPMRAELSEIAKWSTIFSADIYDWLYPLETGASFSVVVAGAAENWAVWPTSTELSSTQVTISGNSFNVVKRARVSNPAAVATKTFALKASNSYGTDVVYIYCNIYEKTHPSASSTTTSVSYGGRK